MDKSSHVTLGGLLAGVVLGFPAGVLFQLARSAWKSHASYRASADAAGRVKWRLSGQAVVLGFLLLVAAALTLGGVAAGLR